MTNQQIDVQSRNKQLCWALHNIHTRKILTFWLSSIKDGEHITQLNGRVLEPEQFEVEKESLNGTLH
jgi:hypothetical protein